MYALLSDDLEPKVSQYLSRFYYLKVHKDFFKTNFPQKRLHDKLYQIQVEHVDDLVTFWAVETDELDIRSEMEDKFAQLHSENRLEAFVGQPKSHQLALAPYAEDDNAHATYHRVLVINPKIIASDKT